MTRLNEKRRDREGSQRQVIRPVHDDAQAVKQPDAYPGPILIKHYLRDNEWPGLRNSGVAA